MIGIASLGMGNISAITNIYDDYDIKYVILRSSKDYEKKLIKLFYQVFPPLTRRWLFIGNLCRYASFR